MTRYHPNQRRKHRFSSIDEFDIIKELGKGGYSVVYLAEHIKNGRKYAIKCAMKYKKGRDRSDRAWEEISVMSKLHHPNVMRLKGWFEDKNNVYLVLQYVRGGDLSSYLSRNMPSREEIADIMIQLVEAVQYCHDNGIIHRDMKLENILMTRDSKIILTDFGLCAVRSHDEEYFDHEVGTTRYSAPELIQGYKYGESVDVWGIGIIFFLLLTGRYPFDGSKRKSIYRRIVNKRLNFDEYDLSEEEEDLLSKMLEKDPNYRIQLKDILYHPWLNGFYDSDD